MFSKETIWWFSVDPKIAQLPSYKSIFMKKELGKNQSKSEIDVCN